MSCSAIDLASATDKLFHTLTVDSCLVSPIFEAESEISCDITLWASDPQAPVVSATKGTNQCAKKKSN